jgi:hypothetical protein
LRAAPDASDEGGGGFRFQNVAVKYPGTISERMFRRDLATLDGEAECSGTDAEPVSGFGEIHPPL